jgi:hypothetical protein
MALSSHAHQEAGEEVIDRYFDSTTKDRNAPSDIDFSDIPEATEE